MPFNNIGPMELIIVLVIALLVIGPKRLPEREFARARGCGSSRSRSAARAGTTRRTTRPTAQGKHQAKAKVTALKISRRLLDEVVEHAYADAPKSAAAWSPRVTARRSPSIARSTRAKSKCVRDGPARAAADHGGDRGRRATTSG